MDKIWLDHNLNLSLIYYKVIGTGCEQGYLEFMGNSTTLAHIQYKKGLFKTFSDHTLLKFMTKKMLSSLMPKWSYTKVIQDSPLKKT